MNKELLQFTELLMIHFVTGREYVERFEEIKSRIETGHLDEIAEWANKCGLSMNQTEELEDILNRHF